MVLTKLDAIRARFEEEIANAADDLQEIADTMQGMTMYNEVDYTEMNKGLKKIIAGIKYIEDNS